MCHVIPFPLQHIENIVYFVLTTFTLSFFVFLSFPPLSSFDLSISSALPLFRLSLLLLFGFFSQKNKTTDKNGKQLVSRYPEYLVPYFWVSIVFSAYMCVCCSHCSSMYFSGERKPCLKLIYPPCLMQFCVDNY